MQLRTLTGTGAVDTDDETKRFQIRLTPNPNLPNQFNELSVLHCPKPLRGRIYKSKRKRIARKLRSGKDITPNTRISRINIIKQLGGSPTRGEPVSTLCSKVPPIHDGRKSESPQMSSSKKAVGRRAYRQWRQQVLSEGVDPWKVGASKHLNGARPSRPLKVSSTRSSSELS
jgi:hypothetical protein